MKRITPLYHLTLRYMTGSPEALCSRAWRTKDRLASRLLIMLVGQKHCQHSHGWWQERI
ncbi:MAG: hypothetical protein AAFQ54_05500 [Pseudomonadota bacterium]